MASPRRRPLPAPIVLFLAAAWGCAGYEERLAEVRAEYARGAYERCEERLRELAEDDPENAHLYSLEEGIVELGLGRPAEAERALLRGMRGLDATGKSGFGEWTAALFSDDRALVYPGEDYEHILVRALLGVASLLGDRKDADAYANSVIERQLEIMDGFEDRGAKPKAAYRLVAFGAYLRAILAEESPLKVDVAREEFERVVQLEPDFPHGAADLERAANGKHSEKGNGVVHVLALVGQGPFKIEVEEQATAAAIAIAQIIWAIYRDRITFPNITGVKIPALAFHRDNPTAVEVRVDGSPAGITATVTDVERTAREQFDTMKDYILARAVVRRVFKVVATEAAKEGVDRALRGSGGLERDLAALALSIFGIVWTEAERADTRSWGLLPAKVQALRIELPAGKHEISLQALRGGSPSGAPQAARVLVRDGYNTYVLGIVPTLAGGPPPLSSEPVEAAGDEIN
jgi:hypothetical protein